MTPIRFAVAVAACLALAGCVGDAPAAPQDAAPPADPSTDYRSPSAVCSAFAMALYRVDTTIDPGPLAAYRRATAYVTPNLGSVAWVDTTTWRWQEWTAHQAYTEVTATRFDGDALPAAGGGAEHRAAVVTSTPVGRDGWRGESTVTTVHCVLRLVDDEWRVDGYEFG